MTLPSLVPTLRPGDVVIMDNLSPHKSVDTLSSIQQLYVIVTSNLENQFFHKKGCSLRATYGSFSAGAAPASSGLRSFLSSAANCSSPDGGLGLARSQQPLVGLAISFALPTYARQKEVADPQTTQKILAVVKT